MIIWRILKAGRLILENIGMGQNKAMGSYTEWLASFSPDLFDKVPLVIFIRFTLPNGDY